MLSPCLLRVFPGLLFSLISTSRAPRSALWLPTADSSAWSSGKGAPQVAEGAEEVGEEAKEVDQLPRCFGTNR